MCLLVWESESVSQSLGWLVGFRMRGWWMMRCVVWHVCAWGFFFSSLFPLPSLWWVAKSRKKKCHFPLMGKAWRNEDAVKRTSRWEGWVSEWVVKKVSTFLKVLFKNVLFWVTGLGNGPFFVKVWHQWNDRWRTSEHGWQWPYKHDNFYWQNIDKKLRTVTTPPWKK